MNRCDILLAIIAAADGEALQPVHLQTVAFLVGDEFQAKLPADYYQFDQHNYGPFCADINRDAEMLEYWGCIQICRAGEHGKPEYSLAIRASMDKVALPPKVLRFIKETVDWARRQSFDELMRSILYMYPEYQENTVFDYSEEQAFLDSFRRGLMDWREGRVYPAREWLEKLRSEMESV